MVGRVVGLLLLACGAVRTTASALGGRAVLARPTPCPLRRASLARATVVGVFNGARLSGGDELEPVMPAANKQPPAAPKGPGGGKQPSLLLRMLILAASSSAAVLARFLRPLARVLQPLQGLLRTSARDSPRVRFARFMLALGLIYASSAMASSVFGLLSGAPRAPPVAAPVEMAYSAFLQAVDASGGAGAAGGGAVGAISNLRVTMKRLDFLVDGRAYFARPVLATPSLLSTLAASGLEFRAPAPGRLDGVAGLLLPLLWLGGIGWFYARQNAQMSGGVGTRASTATLGPALSFDDVQGIAQAKAEVVEIVQMLRAPARYVQAGVRIPSGLLLAGPPGTGKTLLARVLAAEAGVPFFFCSGSDFVEIFVGRGASRLRSLFAKAVRLSPCVIFIDELDALGKRRSMRLTGGNDEAEQTLNQLLACMDGVDSSNNGVIVVGATNRASLLDPALLRPGRFDRIVQIDLPDAQGRADILAVHTRNLKLAPDVKLGRVAELVPGLSGAELSSICNEAAIRMVRRGGTAICQLDFESAIRDYLKSRQLAPTNLLDKLLLGQS